MTAHPTYPPDWLDLSSALADGPTGLSSGGTDLPWARVPRAAWLSAASWVWERGWRSFVDLTVTDRLSPDGRARDEVRFELCLLVGAEGVSQRICLRTFVPLLGPTVSSVASLWPGAAWFEREAFDLYGIRFLAHPDLRRILLYPEFVGHPLRKDYPKDRRQPLVRIGPSSFPRGPA